ncbi:MAG: 3-alpha,7-alpha,12-alpha-trihydroxy-5-beta-cholest-24-enoyl-CoA hydratase [Pseudomonadales bacterium]|nr:3-alpha,7-alpha,12-alpha-trihydroxy-5-beta-cholest-24-enoyl-CoA hydratase [Pseudomonadales bacterium]
MAEKISSELVGLETEAIPFAWSEKDVQLYAIAVGCKPESELDFVYEARGPKVLPTYSVISGLNIMGSVMSKVQFNLAMLLHGEQQIELHRTIPAKAKAVGRGKIVEVWDKGKAAVIGVECKVEDDDGPLYTTHATLFIRGAGGFGGERGPSSKDTAVTIPDRAPDHIVEDCTREEQAALYRLTGDKNPIHIDPNFAKFGGFEKPFLHGLCTYGFAGRAVLHSLCKSDPQNFISMSARFSDQVYMGDAIIGKIWDQCGGDAVMSVETQKGNLVLNQCRIRYRSE